MNNQNLFIGIFLFFCLPTFILGQEAEKYKGMWKGELHDSVEIFFGQKQWAITPGQSVVVYESNVCLGGAIIESAIDKAQEPLSEKMVAA